MKISIHTMYFLPEFGSAPILMNEKASFLADRGHNVEVVTTIPRPPHHAPYKGKLSAQEKRDSFLVKRFRTNSTQNALGRLLAWNLYTLYTFFNLLTLRRGDVLFLRLPPLQLGLTGILARKLKGIRFILNVQDIHPDLAVESGILRNPFFIRLAQGFEKWIYKHSECIVVISKGLKRNLVQKSVPQDKLHILPNWVDTDFLKPLAKDNPVARKYRLHDKFVAMYSGTISISSNLALERVLEAAGLLRGEKDLIVALVGEGLKKESLQKNALALGLENVRFIPFQPYRDLPNLLSSADVLLVPLDKEKSHLSVPSKLYNFMAAGRPILGLADPSSEVAELITSTRCGLCVPPDDPTRIAEALRHLRNSPEEAKTMGEAGRRYAETSFSENMILKQYEELILSLGR